MLPDFINNLKKKTLVKIDDGALIANDNQDPPALITKSDGSYMYLTTDIGTILYREKTLVQIIIFMLLIKDKKTTLNNYSNL